MSQRMITVVVVALAFYLVGVKYPGIGQTALAKIGM